MKRVVLLIDAAADFPYPELGDRTPLECARLPTATALAKEGQVGGLRLRRPGPDSARSLLAEAMGFAPRAAAKLRWGPLGVLAHGGEWREGRVAYLAHFIHVDSEGVQHPVSPASQQDQEELLQDLESEVRKRLPGTDPAFLGLTPGRFVVTFSASSRRLSAPPVVYHYPGLLRRLDPVLRSILEQIRSALDVHPVNELRRDLGELPVSGVWCWSGGHRLPEPPVRRAGCALLSPDPFIKGLAAQGQMPFLSLPDPYHASGSSFPTRDVKELLRTHDELLIWIPAPFASEDFQEAQEKVRRMVEMDYRLLGPIRALLQEEDRAGLLLAAAGVRHRGRPERGLAPCLLWGTGVSPDPVSEWTEAAGMEGRLGVTRWSSLLETFRK